MKYPFFSQKLSSYIGISILNDYCLFVLLGFNVLFINFSVISRRYPLVAVRTKADFLGAASPEHYAADTVAP